jgi:hypothetical protein
MSQRLKIVVVALTIAVFVISALSVRAAVQPGFYLPSVLYSPADPPPPTIRVPRPTRTPTPTTLPPINDQPTVTLMQ